MTILTRPECLELLSQAPVGRIGASIDALPVILPVHFGLFEESVLFRTIPGTKLDAATLGAVVAFQADGRELRDGTYWSVLLPRHRIGTERRMERCSDHVGADHAMEERFPSATLGTGRGEHY